MKYNHFPIKLLSRYVHEVNDCVAGDNNNQIHFEGYQVSNQCMALVRDDCLIPTKDVPELGYVKESSNEQYVPDVFYKVYMMLFPLIAFLGNPNRLRG